MFDELKDLRLPSDLDVTEQVREPAPEGTYIFTTTEVISKMATHEDEDGEEVDARSYLMFSCTALAEDNPRLSSDEEFEQIVFADVWQSDEEQERQRQRRIRMATERQGKTVDESKFGYPPPIIQTYRVLHALGLMERVKTGISGGRAQFSYQPIGWKLEELGDVLINRVPGCKFSAKVTVTTRGAQRFNRIESGSLVPVIQ